MLRKISIRLRIWLLLTASLSVVTAIGAYDLYHSRQLLIAEKKAASVNQVRTAHSVVSSYYQQYLDGAVSEVEAKRDAKFAIQGMATSKRSYMYIYHFENFMPMHPFMPQSVHPDDTPADVVASRQAQLDRVTGIMHEKRMNVIDPTPLDLFMKLHARSMEGFVEYLFTTERMVGRHSVSAVGDPLIHPAAEEKLVYGKAFEPWQWVIFTGVYMDDVDAAFIASAKTLATVLALLGGALLIAGYFITRSITQPLSQLSALMDDISHGSGDLTNRLSEQGRDELAQMGKGFNLFVEKLGGMIKDMLESNRALKQQSQTLWNAVRSSTDRIQEQLQETEMLASATTELSASFNEVAINAQDSVSAAHDAEDSTNNARLAVQGNKESIAALTDALNHVQETMRAMQTENNQVNSMIAVIRGIAEQTNLLALNAAIEAARAGEQGRGFAVVADEVRQLAQKTQSATAEINAIIERLNSSTQDAVSAMEHGMNNTVAVVDSADKVNAMLQSVIDSVNIITEKSTSIAAAVQQQTATTESIAETSVSIAEANQTTASEGNTCREANTQMNECIDRLARLMEQFKVS